MTATAARSTIAPDASAIHKAVELLSAGVVELRAFAPDRYSGTVTISGYFDDYARLAKEAVRLNADGAECYVTMNPVNGALLARRANRTERKPKSSTSDNDVPRRLWFLNDIDATRPADISATDAEHEAALARAEAIRDYLRYNHAWPEPLVADSGNGAHLLYRIDLPNDDAARLLLQRCLVALAMIFDDEAATVDQTVFNSSRIVKLYGCLARKGDDTFDRPHRLSKILHAPNPIHPVTLEQLAELAALVPAEEKPHESNGSHKWNGNGRIDVDAYLREHGIAVRHVKDWNGGRRWLLQKCVWCESEDKAAVVLQFPSGAVAASCRHDRCTGKKWHDFRDSVEPGWRDRREQRQERRHERNGHAAPEDDPEPEPIERFTFAELQAQYPTLYPPVVHGLFREGESCNVISVSKVGKSWLGYSLALAIITGRPWLDRFETSPGKVLVVDNELHRPTLANRIPTVADALAIPREHYAEDLVIWPLRGNLRSLAELGTEFETIEPGEFKLILLDAKYRFASPGVSENDNAAETLTYNMLDRFAERTRAAFVLIHHSSKGSQSEKRTTDVGAGAGAQSRAADCHLILREHEEENVVVLEAAVRSFAPVEPLALRWSFPLWLPAEGVDPARLKGRLTPGEQRQSDRDLEGVAAICKVLEKGSATTKQIRLDSGMGKDRCDRLLGVLYSRGDISRNTVRVRGQDTYEYALTTEATE